MCARAPGRARRSDEWVGGQADVERGSFRGPHAMERGFFGDRGWIRLEDTLLSLRAPDLAIWGGVRGNSC